MEIFGELASLYFGGIGNPPSHLNFGEDGVTHITASYMRRVSKPLIVPTLVLMDKIAHD